MPSSPRNCASTSPRVNRAPCSSPKSNPFSRPSTPAYSPLRTRRFHLISFHTCGYVSMKWPLHNAVGFLLQPYSLAAWPSCSLFSSCAQTATRTNETQLRLSRERTTRNDTKLDQWIVICQKQQLSKRPASPAVVLLRFKLRNHRNRWSLFPLAKKKLWRCCWLASAGERFRARSWLRKKTARSKAFLPFRPFLPLASLRWKSSL